jgi:small subunit ribosomal protein S15
LPKQEKGQSHQSRPVSKRPPSWCRYAPEEVEALVIKLAKEGNSPSKIGTILRDKHGIPLTRPITGKSITQVLKDQGIAPAMPEDLDILLKKASALATHLERNKGDQHNKRNLQIIEAKIHKLSKYYKNEGVLSSDWKYKPKIASIT